MHLVIGYRNSFQVKVLHAINLKLEGECRLQMTIDTIFCELQREEQVALNIKRGTIKQGKWLILTHPMA